MGLSKHYEEGYKEGYREGVIYVIKKAFGHIKVQDLLDLDFAIEDIIQAMREIWAEKTEGMTPDERFDMAVELGLFDFIEENLMKSKDSIDEHGDEPEPRQDLRINRMTDGELDEAFRRVVAEEIERKFREGKPVSFYDSEREQMYYIENGERIYINDRE